MRLSEGRENYRSPPGPSYLLGLRVSLGARLFELFRFVFQINLREGAMTIFRNFEDEFIFPSLIPFFLPLTSTPIQAKTATLHFKRRERVFLSRSAFPLH